MGLQSDICRKIAQQSDEWDDDQRRIGDPGARLLMAIVEQAVFDMTHFATPYHAEPDVSCLGEKDRKKAMERYGIVCTEWRKRRREAEDAEDFLTGERIHIYCDHLGLSYNWLKEACKRYAEFLKSEEGRTTCHDSETSAGRHSVKSISSADRRAPRKRRSAPDTPKKQPTPRDTAC